MTYVSNWREDFKYRIRPDMTACSWQDVNIQDLTNYPRNKAPRTIKLRPMQVHFTVNRCDCITPRTDSDPVLVLCLTSAHLCLKHE